MIDIKSIFNENFPKSSFSNIEIRQEIKGGVIMFMAKGLSELDSNQIHRQMFSFKIDINEVFEVEDSSSNQSFNKLIGKNYFDITYFIKVPLSKRITRPSMLTLLGLYGN